MIRGGSVYGHRRRPVDLQVEAVREMDLNASRRSLVLVTTTSDPKETS